MAQDWEGEAEGVGCGIGEKRDHVHVCLSAARGNGEQQQQKAAANNTEATARQQRDGANTTKRKYEQPFRKLGALSLFLIFFFFCASLLLQCCRPRVLPVLLFFFRVFLFALPPTRLHFGLRRCYSHGTCLWTALFLCVYLSLFYLLSFVFFFFFCSSSLSFLSFFFFFFMLLRVCFSAGPRRVLHARTWRAFKSVWAEAPPLLNAHTGKKRETRKRWHFWARCVSEGCATHPQRKQMKKTTNKSLIERGVTRRSLTRHGRGWRER